MMVKLAVNQIKKVLPYLHCLRETLYRRKPCDKKLKELEQYWQNDDILTFCAKFLSAFIFLMNLKLSDEKTFGYNQISDN